MKSKVDVSSLIVLLRVTPVCELHGFGLMAACQVKNYAHGDS